MMHELCKCRRCGKVPRHLDAESVTDTGVKVVESYCVDCGYIYTWRVRFTPDEKALLASERRIPAPRLARLRAMEGSTNAQH